ncbi:MAG TPA: hypothetical protein VNF73_16140 [Candidatus Saccharimonadales bacterium]|nr:hypothetical protein [Candidatus Saccharimonadales bacterium]
MSTRTTLALDEDVAARLQQEVHRSGRPFKVVVNEALRAGLDAPRVSEPPFRIEAFDLGLRRGIDLDDIEGLLDRLEGPNRR